MAVVFEEALKKQLEKGATLPVYLLFGEDAFLKKFYSEKIAKAITSPDDIFNFSAFSRDCDLQEVYDSVMQFPFAADKKYVELCDYPFESVQKTDLEKLFTLISEIPDTATFVIRFDSVETDRKKSAKFKKLVSSVENAGGLAVCLDHRGVPELIKMLSSGAAKRNAKLDSATARYLIETAGDDINTLKNELSKLCLYVNGGTITKETVDEVSVKTVEASVFNLSRFIISCDISSSLSLIDELFFMRVEPMSVLYTISSVYTDMLRIYCAGNSSLTPKAVAETFSYKGKEFLLEKAASNLRKFDLKRLRLSLDELCKADTRLKSFGAEPRIILEELVVKLIYIITKGEAVDKA